MTDNLQWRIGEVIVTRVAEQIITMAAADMFPSATEEALRRHAEWAQPWAVDAGGRLQLSIHALCINEGGRKIIVDTCFGPGPLPAVMKSLAATEPFLTYLSDAGFARRDVDLVICTHLHVDHVGWNTIMEEGRRVPTFPNARYLVSRVEFEHWDETFRQEPDLTMAAIFRDSVVPLVDHGVVDLVDTDYQVSPSVQFVSTPGHSPGHVSVQITSNGESALITGDCTHSPLQFAEPGWFSKVDTDTDLSGSTRAESDPPAGRQAGPHHRDALPAADCWLPGDDRRRGPFSPARPVLTPGLAPCDARVRDAHHSEQEASECAREQRCCSTSPASGK